MEGSWIAVAWYAAVNGEFDGRWVQLFDNRLGYGPITPLTLTVGVGQRCATHGSSPPELQAASRQCVDQRHSHIVAER